MDMHYRDVPVKRIVLTSNPDDEETLMHCLSIAKDLAEDEDTKDLNVSFARSKLVTAGEDDILVREGSILVEIHYMDNQVSFTLMCNDEEDDDV